MNKITTVVEVTLVEESNAKILSSEYGNSIKREILVALNDMGLSGKFSTKLVSCEVEPIGPVQYSVDLVYASVALYGEKRDVVYSTALNHAKRLREQVEGGLVVLNGYDKNGEQCYHQDFK